MKKRKGRIRMWILIVLGILVLGMGIGFLVMEPGRREAMNLTMEDLDLSGLKDGIYTGEYKGTKDSLRNCKVEVTVAAGKVTAVKVLEGSLAKGDTPVVIRGGQTIDVLFNRVIDAQSLQVDVISGATITSRVHLKAVENALKQALAN
jgi:uncharacterized protein with FMN-binding domain